MTQPTRLSGILPSLPTFFDHEGRVDHGALQRVARFAVESRAAGLVAFGLAGEVSRLTSDERETLLETLLDALASGTPVLSGATAENTAQSQRLARHAERVGAAGIVLPPPTAYRLTEDDFVDFFADVASATELPVVVQDAPEYLSVSLRPETVLAASARAPNICGVKLETAAEGIERWRRVLGDDFLIFGGNGGLYLLDCLRAGADGVMPGVDTIDFQVEIERAERGGRHAEADELFGRLLPLLVFEMQSIDHYNLCAKHVLRRRGIQVEAELRAPGPRRLEKSSVLRLEEHLKRLGLTFADTASVGW